MCKRDERKCSDDSLMRGILEEDRAMLAHQFAVTALMRATLCGTQEEGDGEVTSAMVRAGCAELATYNDDFESTEDAVKRIYLAMRAADRLSQDRRWPV
jgi:hypothetical protein